MVDYLIHPLDGCFERVRRAGEHLADLDERISDVLRQQANSIVVEFDPNPPHGVNKVLPPTETFFEMRISVLIGEICYNLRSALDYLVYELAKLDSGASQDGTQFPIVDAKQVFEGRREKGLKGVNATHVAAIERLQPYKGCNWTKWLRGFSNPDKHRHFVPAGGSYVAHAYSSIESD